ncbi:hypothetical protein CAEBREN_30877 [Caenorhabditis brenneri]|uniref:Uncharacterized protein n=1 Tax=Caenorhabditis brenneri TaxID=135651 RepID=G0MNH7_CAEBE|nr:hypothetical protein CAEBREN_30877 [Caenorhabditis brenneri]
MKIKRTDLGKPPKWRGGIKAKKERKR